MDNTIYTNLTRLDGLRSELQAIANNIANVSTPGFKKEGVIFSEHVTALENADTSLSMARAQLQRSDLTQGSLTQTGAPLDFAIDGEGFFLVEFGDGLALSRAGNFKSNLNGELVNASGFRLLDAGGAPVLMPPDARQIKMSGDGTLSVDGRLVADIGLYLPAEGDSPKRVADTLFAIAEPPQPLEAPVILQGFQEDSNVNAVLEVARMIEVHRAYERGADLNQSEDERIRTVLRTLGAQ